MVRIIVLANPKHGTLCRIHYSAKKAPFMPHHGKIGRVVVVSKGKPRNHGVEIDGKIVCFACGNLMKTEQ